MKRNLSLTPTDRRILERTDHKDLGIYHGVPATNGGTAVAIAIQPPFWQGILRNIIQNRR